ELLLGSRSRHEARVLEVGGDVPQVLERRLEAARANVLLDRLAPAVGALQGVRLDREGHEQAFAHTGELGADLQVAQDLVVDDRERMPVVRVAQHLGGARHRFLLRDLGDHRALQAAQRIAVAADRIAQPLLLARPRVAGALLRGFAPGLARAAADAADHRRDRKADAAGRGRRARAAAPGGPLVEVGRYRVAVVALAHQLVADAVGLLRELVAPRALHPLELDLLDPLGLARRQGERARHVAERIAVGAGANAELQDVPQGHRRRLVAGDVALPLHRVLRVHQRSAARELLLGLHVRLGRPDRLRLAGA